MSQEMTPDHELSRPRINAEAIALAGRARLWLEQAKASPSIFDGTSHALAQDARKQLGLAKRQVDTIRKAHTAPYLAAVESVRAFFRGTEESIDTAIKLRDSQILAFEREEARRRQEQEARERAQRELEATRLREEAAQLERERKIAEDAALAEAQRLEAAGMVDAVDAVLAAAAAMSAGAADQARTMTEIADVVVAAPLPAVAQLAKGGTQRREYWSATCVNKRKLVEAWLRGEVPDQCIVANEQFLNGQARLLKSSMNYPGVEARSETRIGG